ncbi:hypothetical protein T12_3554 [Trichinella patagoniensis]|uniref:Uncharacterized protein n=1 Tax=Trichinella patagoniensis TaxID=990121 RepID=A0A0V1A0C1_9BILA|nr:hypothetical protein T12_3554 [Trichinella patagoniensis]
MQIILSLQLTLKKKDGEYIRVSLIDMIVFIDGQFFAKFPQLDLRVVEILMPFCPFLPAYA